MAGLFCAQRKIFKNILTRVKTILTFGHALTGTPPPTGATMPTLTELMETNSREVHALLGSLTALDQARPEMKTLFMFGTGSLQELETALSRSLVLTSELLAVAKTPRPGPAAPPA